MDALIVGGSDGAELLLQVCELSENGDKYEYKPIQTKESIPMLVKS